MKVSAAVLLGIFCVGGAVVAEEPACQGLQSVLESHAQAPDSEIVQLLTALAAIVLRHEPSKEECSSVRTVMDELINPTKHGGKRLEDDKPVDINQANSQLAQAQADTEVRQRLELLKSQTTDPRMQLLVEAVVLDSEDYYSARELKIQALRKQLK